MIVRELVAKLGFTLDQGPLKKFESSIFSVKNVVGGLAAALTTGVIVHAFKSMAESAEQVYKASLRLGLATDEVQKLQYAAYQADIDMQTLLGSMAIFATHLQKAKEGSKESVDAFQKAFGKGFDPKSITNNARALEMLADRISGIKDANEKVAILRDLFGRGGAALLPMFAEGSEGIRRMYTELEEFGGVLDENAIAAGKRFNDNLKSTHTFFQAIVKQLTGRLFPVVNQLIEEFLSWAKANREVVQANIVQAAKAMEIAFEAVGAVVKVVWYAFKGIGEILGPTISKLAIAAAIVGALVLAVGALPLAVAVVVGLVALQIDDLISYFQGGKNTVTGILVDLANQLWTWTIPYLQKIRQVAWQAFQWTPLYWMIKGVSQLYDWIMRLSNLIANSAFGKFIANGFDKLAEFSASPFAAPAAAGPGKGGSWLGTMVPGANNVSNRVSLSQNVTINADGGDPQKIQDELKKNAGGFMKEAFDDILRGADYSLSATANAGG